MMYYLSLGSNLGKREHTIRRTLELIEQQIGHILCCSSFYYSEPWRFRSENDFCNLCCCVETDKQPLDLLLSTQSIEQQLGRTHKSVNRNYSDRTIDIDIIRAFDGKGEILLESAELTIPHPLWHERDFVKIPLSEILPTTFISPYQLPPHPLVQLAANELIGEMHEYMRLNPDSELHRQGKMFGILVASKDNRIHYLRAFSAMLDGSYTHEGFVPPVYLPSEMPLGKDRADSQRLQRLLFAQYNFLNGKGETQNLLDIFAKEKPILSPEEYFNQHSAKDSSSATLPPSGAGECCAPKLLQYALSNDFQPIALGEFWIGAPMPNELRQEGCFYEPCSSKCRPILRYMLHGIDTTTESQPANYFKPEILFEDDYLIVANKPAGLLTVTGKNSEPSLASILSDQRGYPVLPAHRLDQDTSGIVVLAKNPDIYKTLQAYFQRRDILKHYEALVRPSVDRRLTVGNEGTITLPLLANPFDRPRQMVDYAHGKQSVTIYRIREKRNNDTWLVDFFPQTGRTHQLRVHAAHPDGLNAPIVGDRLYNGQQTENSTHKGQKAERLMLHAAEISFVHPITKEEMHFCIPSGF